VGFAWNVVNQDGRTACRARVDVLWRRDTGADQATAMPGVDDFVPIPL
jgi:hypothetical protein